METHIPAQQSDMGRAHESLSEEGFTDADPGRDTHESRGESTRGGIGNPVRNTMQIRIQSKLLASSTRKRQKQAKKRRDGKSNSKKRRGREEHRKEHKGKEWAEYR